MLPVHKKVSAESFATSCEMEDLSEEKERTSRALRFLFRPAQLQGAWPYSVNNDGSARVNGKLLVFVSTMLVFYGVSIIGLVSAIAAAIIDGQPYVNIIVSMAFVVYYFTVCTNVYRALRSKREVADYLPKLTALINKIEEWNSNVAAEACCSCHERVRKSSPRKTFGKTIYIYIFCTIASLVPMLVPIIVEPMAVHGFRTLVHSFGTVFGITIPAFIPAVQAILPVSLTLGVGANYSVICIFTAIILYVSHAFRDVSVKVHTLLVSRMAAVPAAQCGAGASSHRNAMKSVSERHLYLSRFVADSNDMFGGYLLSFYANALIQSLACTYYLVYLFKALATTGGAGASVTAWDLLFVSSYTLQTIASSFLFTYLFACFSKVVHDIDLDLYDIAVNDNFTKEERELASQLVSRLRGTPVVISANDYFDVNKSLVLTILGVYLSYILVLLQVTN